MSPDDLRTPGTANPVPSNSDPDLRAIFRGRRFAVVPWQQALRRPHRRAEGEPPEIVFELWERREQGEVLARQHGAGPAGAEIERLQRWAEARGAVLRIGSPIPPAVANRGRTLAIARRRTERPPAFTFIYPPPLGGRRLQISPWGFGGCGLEQLREPWRGVVGEVEALDHARAVVHFAHVDPDQRVAAQRALHGWARADRWQLEIAAELRPLSEPDPRPVSYGGRSVCPECGESYNTGWISHMGFGNRGWVPTGCGLCGGRLRWWGEPEHVEALENARAVRSGA